MFNRNTNKTQKALTLNDLVMHANSCLFSVPITCTYFVLIAMVTIMRQSYVSHIISGKIMFNL